MSRTTRFLREPRPKTVRLCTCTPSLWRVKSCKVRDFTLRVELRCALQDAALSCEKAAYIRLGLRTAHLIRTLRRIQELNTQEMK